MTRVIGLVSFVAWLLVAPPLARADPWLSFGDSRLEDRFASGDVDEEDLAAMPAMGARGVGATDKTARTWVSLVGFYGGSSNDTRTWGGIAVVGVALDRIAQGPTHVTSPAIAEPTPTPTPTPPLTPTPTATPPPIATPPPAPPPLPLPFARATVRAAWRASGIDVDDTRIDDIVARARTSAALPETRVRAMRLFVDDNRSTTSTVDDTGRIYDATGANLWLEARLTWRLDRLLYADDEPTLERVRLEREEARARVASRTLDLLFAWERAAADARAWPAGSREANEAAVRRWEAAVALDVLTGGWFGRQPGANAL